MKSKEDERKIDETLRLVAAFMKVKDEKARAEIINLAESFAAFAPAEALFRFDL